MTSRRSRWVGALFDYSPQTVVHLQACKWRWDCLGWESKLSNSSLSRCLWKRWRHLVCFHFFQRNACFISERVFTDPPGSLGKLSFRWWCQIVFVKAPREMERNFGCNNFRSQWLHLCSFIHSFGIYSSLYDGCPIESRLRITGTALSVYSTVSIRWFQQVGFTESYTFVIIYVQCTASSSCNSCLRNNWKSVPWLQNNKRTNGTKESSSLGYDM